MCDGMCTLWREAGLQSAQTIGGRVRALRMRRSFGRVDVEMIGERMFRIQLQDRLERREDFVRARIRLTFRRPLIPWTQIHHRLGEEDADVRIVRIVLPNLAHRIRVGLIERRAIFRLRIGITMAERLDQVALHRRRVFGVFLRELQFLPGQLRGRRRDEREVDVRSAGERDAPMRHGAFRIEPRRFLKRSDRFAVIETVIKGEALIEITLRLGRIGRDRSRVGAETVEDRLFPVHDACSGQRDGQPERQSNCVRLSFS